MVGKYLKIHDGNSVCNSCGISRPWLHKHHIKPKSLGGTDADGLLRLCANCHEDIHGGPFGGILKGRLSSTPEANAKKAEKMRAYWADPVYRDKLKNRGRGAWSPERRRAHREGIARWREENPEAEQQRRDRISASKRGVTA